MILAAWVCCLAAICPAFSQDDYSWVRGANYIPSYAATDVEIWNLFDPVVVDRELGYAERIGVNSIRIFLQYHVYELYPQRFLDNVAAFVDLCDQHGIRPMLVVFDSCFGVSPSISSGEFWVANPGPDRTNPEFYPAGEQYVRDLVELFRDDPRILLWDVMNEPTATQWPLIPGGAQQVWDFVRHFCDFIHNIDTTHPITVGVAGTDNSQVVDHIDVLSFHSYANNETAFRGDIQSARQQAQAAGKPFIISECCAPGWGCHYEMVMPVLRDEGLGYYFWEIMIARTQFRNVAGLFYADGTVRRLSNIAAVIDGPAIGFTEKPDSQGVPIANGVPLNVLIAPTFVRMTGVACDEESFSERYSFVSMLSRVLQALGTANSEVASMVSVVESLHDSGQDTKAFALVDGLVRIAHNAMFGLQWDDVDADGLLDAAEPAGDADSDGIPNYLDSDADDDELPDGMEVETYGTSALNWDTDGDGASDGAEVRHGTDPLDPEEWPTVPIGPFGPALLVLLTGAAALLMGRSGKERIW